MKGHDKLVQLRLANLKPDMVFIQEQMYGTDWTDEDFPTICIKPDEPLEHLDLRFLVGLAVSVSTSSKERLNELQSICKQYCDVVASALVVQDEGKSTFTTKECEIWQR